MNPKLTNFNDFIKILLASGFSIGGGNDEGIYAIVDYDWLTVPPRSPIVKRKLARGYGLSKACFHGI